MAQAGGSRLRTAAAVGGDVVAVAVVDVGGGGRVVAETVGHDVAPRDLEARLAHLAHRRQLLPFSLVR